MRIDHVAWPVRDPRQTHGFYHGALGLGLVQAYAGKELMLVYALPGGGSLVFSAAKDAAPAQAEFVAWEQRHVGIVVETRAEFDHWLARLREHEIDHQVIDDERIYFADPDGLVLELEVAAQVEINPAASEVLASWIER